MPITSYPDDFFVVNGREIEVFQFLARKSALKLESLGMTRHGRSAYSICKEEYGLKGSKESVLAQMNKIWEDYLASKPGN